MKGPSAKFLTHDFRASIVVFLVALPLAMGIAIASGYPPVAGLVTGVVGGILVGAISGAPLQVSGAAAGLSVLVYQGVQQFGLQGMATVIAIAGLLQVVAGLSGLGRWFQAVSPTVLYAMLAGIGLLIISSQAHVMLDGAPRGNGWANVQAIPSAVADAVGGVSGLAALALAGLTIGLMLLWPKIARKGRLALVPAPLVAVGLATAAAAVLGLDVKYVAIPASLFADFKLASVDFTALWRDPVILGAALQLALIASTESLLSAAAVDQMHKGERANMNRELTAQGVGNAVCGLLGGLPMTGVIVRSSANVQAGAKTRASAMMHGLWLLLLVSLAPGVLGLVPTAALAGLLVFTGVKLVNAKMIKQVYAQGRSELAIYMTTVVVIVAFDLLLGVALGFGLAGLKLLQRLSHLSVKVEPEPNGERVVLSLRGAATFLRLPRLLAMLDRVPHGARVVVRSNELHLIDQACVQHLTSWRQRYEDRGGHVEEDGRCVFEGRSA